MTIIDPPSVFSEIAEWRIFEFEMKQLVEKEPDNQTAKMYLAVATQHIAKHD